jgi:hypothetical protein
MIPPQQALDDGPATAADINHEFDTNLTQINPVYFSLDTDSLGAACGRSQILSTKSEIIDKSESPKLKIQNKP